MKSKLIIFKKKDPRQISNENKVSSFFSVLCVQIAVSVVILFLPKLSYSQVSPPLGIDTSQMILWLNANAGVFNSTGDTAAIGETVYEWHDLSGNNWVFENTRNSNRPELDTSDGFTYLDFTPGDFLENLTIDDSINGLNEFSIFMVVKSRVTNTDNGFLFHRYPPNGSDDGICLRYDRAGANTGRSQVIKAGLLTNTAGNQIETTSNLQTTDRQVITITWRSGGRLYSYIDGAINDSSNNNVAGPISGINQILIGKGAKNSNVNSGWDGYIESLVFYRNQYPDDTITEISDVLPVDLLSFSASHIQENLLQESILLEWSTATETNNDYFTIEKTQGTETFEELVVVPGAGNSSAVLNYAVLDKNPYSGTSYYRLKQTDFDGKFEYVGIVVANTNLIKYEDVKLFPNPSDGISINLNMNTERDREVSLLIYNPFGEIVYSEDFIQEKGNMLKTIYLSNKLSPGIYHVAGRSEEVLFRKNLIVK